MKVLQQLNSIELIDGHFYTSLRDNFVYSKYTAKEIEDLLDRLSKKKYVLDTNCPNCGAPITKSRCEYCDTVFVYLAEQEAKMDRLRAEQEQLKIQVSNAANLARSVHEQQTRQSNLCSILYADNVPCAVTMMEEPKDLEVFPLV